MVLFAFVEHLHRSPAEIKKIVDEVASRTGESYSVTADVSCKLIEDKEAET